MRQRLVYTGKERRHCRPRPVPECCPENIMLALSKAMSVKEEKYRPEDADEGDEDVHMMDVEMMPPPPQPGECLVPGTRGQAQPRGAPQWPGAHCGQPRRGAQAARPAGRSPRPARNQSPRQPTNIFLDFAFRRRLHGFFFFPACPQHVDGGTHLITIPFQFVL